MSEQLVVEAVRRHLDEIASFVNWALVLALPIVWMAVRRKQTYEVLKIEFTAKQAYCIVTVLFLVINLVVVVLFFRLRDLLASVPERKVADVVTVLVSHQWVLNPFSHVSVGGLGWLYGIGGFFGLMIVWSICFASIVLIQIVIGEDSRVAWLLRVLFGVLGLSTAAVIQGIYVTALDRTAGVSPELNSALAAVSNSRYAIFVLGILMGAAVVVGALILQLWIGSVKTTNRDGEI
jgi:hypothetical protein